MVCLWFPLDASSRRRGWECCQCGSVASSNVANFQLGIEIGHWQRGQRLHEMGAAEVGGAMGASPTAFVCY